VAEADRLTGQILASAYRLSLRVATGTVGMIYQAECLDGSRRLAVKLLHPSVSRDVPALERYREDARTTGALGHPHIVEFVDFSPLDGRGAFVVTELLEGEDLDAYMGRVRRLGIRAAVSITRAVLSALGAAHAAGVVHLDLKPANVFLCKRGLRRDFVKLLDFGVAHLGAGGSGTSTRVQGTVRYLSPEQARGDVEAVDARTDVWATGVMLYEMLAGSPAFAGPDRATILTRIAESEPAPLRKARSEVRADLDAVVTRALAKAPADRFSSAEEMREALAAAARQCGAWEEEGDATAAPPLPPPPAAPPTPGDPFAEVPTIPQERAPAVGAPPQPSKPIAPAARPARAATRSWPPPARAPASVVPLQSLADAASKHAAPAKTPKPRRRPRPVPPREPWCRPSPTAPRRS